MSDTKQVEFTLKVMINKPKTKVLFAEIDSGFADVLLSFLTLPLGKIVRVLKELYGEDDQETPVNIGSITNLYNGLANLDIDHFETEATKEMLLNPSSSFEAECRKMKLDISDIKPTKYYPCEDWICRFCIWSNISMHCDDTSRCCRCGKTMKKKVHADKSQEDGASGVFTINTVAFVISDDLRMVPNVAVPIVKTLRNLGITDTDGAELMNVTFGFNEVMDLLKGSLLSPTPLTDLILDKRECNLTIPKYETEILRHEEKEANSNSKKFLLKLMVQKSTNKLLFAQAEEDFVDFLFSLLTIPLGGVESLLGGNTCLRSIDNLYNWVANLIDDKYLANTDLKIEWLTYSSFRDYPFTIYTEGYGNYVKGPKTFMVSDDLTVTPWSMSSCLSVLNELKILLSDVETVEMQIGLQEALSILKASLTSASALTDGLKINPMLRKQPKQEHR